ncbi:MAG TPA: hypothetical protein DD666_13980 [Advenella kashmirensis]|uniref:Uncharacterized protein n=1 Tax=Advenella kashmirensis TaxID=310575 RepID=A0A356LHW9_9BURK|nr:hypothetical protein [Advenella kashmirensis]
MRFTSFAPSTPFEALGIQGAFPALTVAHSGSDRLAATASAENTLKRPLQTPQHDLRHNAVNSVFFLKQAICDNSNTQLGTVGRPYDFVNMFIGY